MPPITALRRAIGTAPPPLAPARAKLAVAIAADRQAAELLHRLETAYGLAYTELQNAETALAAATAAAEEADKGAHLHAVNRLLGDPAPGTMTRAEAAAKLAAAQDSARDAEAAWREIGRQAEVLRAGERDRRTRVTEAAQAVLREEAQGAVATLTAGLREMHNALVDGHKLLAWLVRNDVTADWGPKAAPGVGELVNRTMQAPQTWTLWHSHGTPVAITRWETALDALRRDATAPVPT